LAFLTDSSGFSIESDHKSTEFGLYTEEKKLEKNGNEKKKASVSIIMIKFAFRLISQTCDRQERLQWLANQLDLVHLRPPC
jgi:hypothetical protein